MIFGFRRSRKETRKKGDKNVRRKECENRREK
jgi:hypothetical protein